MAIVSVSVDEQTRNKMRELDEINWSAVARNAFAQKIKEVELIRELTKKSTLTQEDANHTSNKISADMSEKFLKL